jgi:Ca2+-binding RTX toxin-like protein
MAFVSLDGSGNQAINIPELTSLLDVENVQVISQTPNQLTARAVANGIPLTAVYTGNDFGTDSAIITGFSGRSDDGSYIVEVDEIFLTSSDFGFDPNNTAEIAQLEARLFSGDDLVLGSVDGGSLMARLGSGNDNVVLYSGFENKVNTNQGADWIEGFGGSGQLLGGLDNDLIELHDGTSFSANGNLGNDTLINYGGTNTLQGGKGNDTLISSGGNSRLIGNLGVDVFIFSENGFANVVDYSPGVDQLDFSNLKSYTLVSEVAGTSVLSNNTTVGFIDNYFS